MIVNKVPLAVRIKSVKKLMDGLYQNKTPGQVEVPDKDFLAIYDLIGDMEQELRRKAKR